jgi:hypothetical protein
VAALLAGSRVGKTSLAAALIRDGCALLTDDVLPLQQSGGEFTAYPGYPQMRMWPPEAERFVGGVQGLDLVHPTLEKRRVPVLAEVFGRFCDSPRPLARVYLLQRQDGGLRDDDPPAVVEKLAPRDQVMELLRHGYLTHVMPGYGDSAERLRFFAALAEAVPVQRLRYHGGSAHESAVSRHVRGDLARLP